MKEKTDKIITLAGLGIALIGIVMAVIFAMNNGGVKDLAAVNKGGLFDLTYWILGCFIIIALAAMLVFLCVKLANRFKTVPGYAKKFFIILGLVVVVCVLSYVLAKGNDVTLALMEKNEITEATSKLIGAACIMVYILVIGAAGCIVYSEIAKSLKNK